MVLSELEASGYRDVGQNGERPVHDAITYLQKHGHRMNYTSAIRRGLPIGSGIGAVRDQSHSKDQFAEVSVACPETVELTERFNVRPDE